LKFGGFGAQGLTRVSRKEEYEPDRFQRLKVAEQLVRRDGEVGKLSDNTRWIEDELLMEWGLIYAPPTDPAPGPLAVLFIGERNGQVLALNGSAQHVIGYKGQGPPIRGSSHTTFWTGTWSRFEINGSFRGLDFLARSKYFKDSLHSIISGKPPRILDPFERVLMEMEDNGWPQQQVHFLANRLIERNDAQTRHRELLGLPKVHVTIGTPLYVIGI
jgi:hypothetical protein